MRIPFIAEWLLDGRRPLGGEGCPGSTTRVGASGTPGVKGEPCGYEYARRTFIRNRALQCPFARAGTLYPGRYTLAGELKLDFTFEKYNLAQAPGLELYFSWRVSNQLPSGNPSTLLVHREL